MPAQFTYPGVYISEKPSGARAIPAAATSTAMFVGMTDMGPFEKPTRVQSLADYGRLFGETSSGEMSLQVGQFFINGGGDAYIMRIAENARSAAIEIQNENDTDNVLTVTSRDVGLAGNGIRVEVDYATNSPERTFNLTVFRNSLNPDGSFNRSDEEFFGNLSMDPLSPRFVNNVIGIESNLITAESTADAPSDPAGASDPGGSSISGLILRVDAGEAQTDLFDILSASGGSFQISINHRPPVTAVIDKSGLTSGNLATRVRDAIIAAYGDQFVALTGLVSTNIVQATGTLGRVFEIRSTEGPVVITQAANDDCSLDLMLGVDAGGIEIDAYSPLRPAPSGIFTGLGTYSNAPTSSWLNRIFAIADRARNEVTRFALTDPGNSGAPYAGDVVVSGTPASLIGHGAVPTSATALGSMNMLRDALDDIIGSAGIVVGDRWRVERQGVRIVLRANEELGPIVGRDGVFSTDDAGGTGYNVPTTANISSYTLGTDAGGGFQDNGNIVPAQLIGSDGLFPKLGDYQRAFDKIHSEVEIFNMMVLPRAMDQTDTDRQGIWGAASSFCAKRRAILFVDPHNDWNDMAEAEAGASEIKLGVNTRHSVVYWPLLKVPTAEVPSGKLADPSGSMAGLYARTDSRFGTWRAPAGIEATLTSVLGTSHPMSDDDNGRINPKALNAIREFPSGVTSWGARMMVGADDTGNVDDKYINVRRMMLFIENSLYSGLRFAVFKNNAEPLWASIRLAAGSFMNGLMMQGAFASQTKSKAYYVLCDDTTTTENDKNLGIVNVIVGFAPNKPSEFVHITVTQIAGQTEV